MKHPCVNGTKLRQIQGAEAMTTALQTGRNRPYGAAEFMAEFRISRETRERLDTYAALLSNWQKTINLVAPSTLDDVWRRHFADSAQLLALAPPCPSAWLDLGSGAGFPGLVIAILLAGSPSPPGQAGSAAPRVTLVESDQRKAAFLGEVARRTGVPVDILVIRIESLATRFKLPPGGVVSARALAPLSQLLRLSCPFLGARSVGLFLKGREAEAEVAEAARLWDFKFRLLPSVTDAEARVVVIRDFAGESATQKTNTQKTKR